MKKTLLSLEMILVSEPSTQVGSIHDSDSDHSADSSAVLSNNGDHDKPKLKAGMTVKLMLKARDTWDEVKLQGQVKLDVESILTVGILLII